MPEIKPVSIDDLQNRHGILYSINSEEPYNGPLKAPSKSDSFVYEGFIKDGLFNGTTSKLNLNGIKILETTTREGKLDGLESEWYKNGKKKSETNFLAGEKHGLETWWFENENKRYETNWKHGKENGLSQEWHGNGQLKLEETLVGGKNIGLKAHWFDNGQKKSEVNYKDGNKIDEKTWHDNGARTAYQPHFVDGKLAVTIESYVNTTRIEMKEHGLNNIQQLIDDKIISVNITDHSPGAEMMIYNFFANETAVDYIKQVIDENGSDIISAYDEEKHKEFVSQIDAKYPSS